MKLDESKRIFVGERELPKDTYYGVLTLRGKENFSITGRPMSAEPFVVKAFGYVKKMQPFSTVILVYERRVLPAKCAISS